MNRICFDFYCVYWRADYSLLLPDWGDMGVIIYCLFNPASLFVTSSTSAIPGSASFHLTENHFSLNHLLPLIRSAIYFLVIERPTLRGPLGSARLIKRLVLFLLEILFFVLLPPLLPFNIV